MNADAFNTHSACCPVCHRVGAIQPHKLITGLLTCQHCRAHLVVSWSGHYVRDPFTKYRVSGQMLRRESHPWARFWRDFRLTTRPIVLALVGTAMFAGTAFLLSQTSPLEPTLPIPESVPSEPIPLPKIEPAGN